MNKHKIEHDHFYYIKDLLGNIRETYVYPWEGYKECVQRTQYYPSGLPWVEAMMPSEQPWKYNGKEFVEMHGLDEYDSKARWYYPAICRTTTMDPLAEKYYATSPYAWCGNNFVRNVDLNGMDVYTFGEDGYFINSHKQEGAHYGMVLSADETLNYTFDFVDPINDPKAIDNGLINKILSLKSEQISDVLSKSGVYNIHGVKDKYSFIYRESNANNIEGDGRMDYVINGQINNVPIVLYEDYLFITDTQGQKYAHNTYNFGNFLWGAGADALGIPYFMVKIGSNINNYLNDPYSKGQLDSKDDQLSIKLGFQWNEK